MNDAVGDLCVENVHVWRGDRHVLKGVSLQVAPGELLHILGPNGTGKTTLLRVVTGLLRPEHGRVLWCGQAIGGVREDYQSALAYVSHEPALKADLTPLENLRFMVGLRRRVSSSELNAQLQRCGVAACADLPVRVLSAGQRRRVVMARVLAVRAPIWLLDEPFTNLDMAGSELVTTLLAEHVSGGGLALVVAHRHLEVAATMRCLELAA